MTKRPRFLIIAALLTFLDLAMVVCYGWPVLDDMVGRPLEPRDFGSTCGVGSHLARESLDPSGSRTKRFALRPESGP
jgi:hypothetical protein